MNRRIAVTLVMVLLLTLVGVASAQPEAPPDFVLKWGSQGSDDGQFSFPRGVAVDASGNVYVADSNNHRIQKFDGDGDFVAKWGSSGNGNGQFLYPSGVAVDTSGNVYVADTGNNRIQKFTSGGTHLASWGTAGSGEGQFTAPYGVAVDTSGNIYVAENGNHRIQVLDASGNYVTKWGSYGSDDGKFVSPYDVALDASGNVYVVDSSNYRIQKFDSAGSFLIKWGSYGNDDREFNYPRGVGVDASGDVYVTCYNRVQKFDSTGTFLSRWGSSLAGTGDGEFTTPHGVAIVAGNVYVVDSYNHRVQKFAYANLPPIQVLDSQGDGLAGVGIQYYDGYWRNLGTTGSDGTLTATVPDGTWSFQASYGGTSQTKTGTIPGGSVQFQTAKATAHVKDSGGSDLPGAGVQYYAGYWRGIGNTGSDGKASVELFPGTYDFKAEVGGTSDTESLVLDADGETVEFQTAKATAHVKTSDDMDYPGVGISYYAGYWRGIGSTGSDGKASVELFPGTYDFQAQVGGTSDTESLVLDADGETVEFQTAKATAHVKTSDDADYPGAGISYYAGYWRGIGNTDSSGEASVELFPGTYDFKAAVGGTSETKSLTLPSTGNTVEFQTAKATAWVHDCDDNPISGAGISYYAGYDRGIGSTDGDGQASVELFPGTYNFKASYGGTSATESLTLDRPGATVGFTITKIEVDYGGSMAYYAGYWRGFSSPLYLFPGTYTFKFDGTQKVVEVSGCTLEGKLTVELPGLSGIRVEIYRAGGPLVTYKNNQSGQAVFDLDNAAYDVVLKTGAKTKVVEDVFVFGDTTLDGIVATLTVDLEGLSGIRVEVHTDDGAGGTAGGLVFYHNNQSGLRTYAVLKNSYDVVLKQGAKTKVVDAVNCYADTCTAGDLVAPLRVDYEGLSGIRFEVHTDDGDDDNSAGGLVYYHNNQSGVKSYDVLKNHYDLVFQQGAKTKHVDVDCTGDLCDAGDIVAALMVNYEGLAGIRFEVHTDNRQAGTAGGLVYYHNNQSGVKSYDVLKNHYDLVFQQGAKTKIVDGVDCTGNTCTPGDIVASLAVDYEGLTGVRFEVHTDNGQEGSVGGLVYYHNNQSGVKSYDVLKNHYDLVFQQGAKTKVVDAVNCTDNTCTPGDIVATLSVDYEGLTGVRFEVHTDDGNTGSVGGLVYYHNNQSGQKTYDVLKNRYDLVFQQGAKIKVVDALDCTGDACSPGDVVATLTIGYGSLTGVRMEVHINDGAIGSVGGLVYYHNNQSGVRSYDLLRNYYDIVLLKNGNTGIADAVDCTGNTCTLAGSNLTVKAPHNTSVQVKQDGTGTTVASGTVPSGRQMTFSDLPIGIYDVVLTQGAGTLTVENLFHIAGTTLDMLNTLTVKGPQNTQVKVQTSDGGVLTSGTMPSGREMTLYVLRHNAWDLYLKQGAGETTIDMDNSGASTAVDRLNTLTVKGPHNTAVAVQTSDGSGTLTSGTMPSGQQTVLYVLRNDGSDATPDWRLSMTQGAGNIVVPSFDASTASTEIDKLHTLTVKGPQNTQVQVQTSGGGVLTSGTMPSGRQMVLYVLRHDAWDLYLKQGGGETTIDMDNSDAATTVDRLTTLTVKGPHNTAVAIQTSDGSGTLTSGTMPSGQQMVLYVLRNDGSDTTPDWRLSMTQGAGNIVVPSLDASTDSTTVDRLNTLTVKGPHNTAVAVQTSDGSGTLTGGTMPSGREMTLYVLRNDGIDSTPDWRLSMTQGAGNIVVPSLDASGTSMEVDKLNTLTVKAPHNTQVQVQTSEGGLLTGGTMPSGRQMTLYVLRVDNPGWQLYLQQNAAVTTVPAANMDNSGPATTQDDLCTLTVNGPSGTAVTATLNGNYATGGTIPSGGTLTLYVVRNATSYDVNGQSVDCSGAAATVTLP